MGLEHSRLSLEVVSDRKSRVFGDPFRVAGHAIDVQFYCPVAHRVSLEVSNDRSTWDYATDSDGNDINGPMVPVAVDDYREVRERPEWVRLRVTFDQAGPRIYRALIGTHKRTN